MIGGESVITPNNINVESSINTNQTQIYSSSSGAGGARVQAKGSRKAGGQNITSPAGM